MRISTMQRKARCVARLGDAQVHGDLEADRCRHVNTTAALKHLACPSS